MDIKMRCYLLAPLCALLFGVASGKWCEISLNTSWLIAWGSVQVVVACFLYVFCVCEDAIILSVFLQLLPTIIIVLVRTLVRLCLEDLIVIGTQDRRSHR